MRVFPKRGDLYPGDADLAEYLSYLRDGYDQDPAGTEPHRAITGWIINLIFRQTETFCPMGSEESTKPSKLRPVWATRTQPMPTVSPTWVPCP